MNIVRTGVRSVWKRSWTFLGVKLQHLGSERVNAGAENRACSCMRQILHTFSVNLNLQDTCPVYMASGASETNA